MVLSASSGVLFLLMGATSTVTPRAWAGVIKAAEGCCLEANLMRTIGLLGPLDHLVQRLMGGECRMMDAGSRRALPEKRTVRPPTTPEAALAATGKQAYDNNCAVCHGLQGDGRGMAAHMFATQPRDFRTGVFKFRSTPAGSLPRDADLLRVLQQGVRRTAMVPQTHLTETEQRAVIAYLKTFSPRWREEEPEPPMRIPEPPAKTSALVAQGQELYQAAGCAQCHGLAGRGDGPQAKELKDDWGWPIRPANLQQRPLKGGSTLKDIYRTLATGLDGTPMPALAEALSAEELWALVYYVDALAPSDAVVHAGTLVGEESRGQMVEHMHGMMGGMMGDRPMMERMRRRRPMRE